MINFKKQIVVWIATFLFLVSGLFYTFYTVSDNKKNHNLPETAFTDNWGSFTQNFDSLRNIDIAEFRSLQSDLPLNPYLGIPRGLGCYTETIYT